MSRLPHPIPYQGSKRKLASAILECTPNRGIQTLYEPFAGSGAITIAAAFRGLAEGFVIADSLDPLSRLWEMMIEAPATTADNYEHLWQGQLEDGRSHFLAVRDDFNQSRDPVKLLYLLARCVKNSPRFNGRGDFNQSADHRRRGMDPHKMRREIAGVSELLRGRVKILRETFAKR
jgi:DNA adenine methylase